MCLDIPFSECGMGECVNNTFCLCYDGWSQNREFFFEISDEQVAAGLVLYCDYNEVLIIVIASILLALYGIVLPLLYLAVLKTKSQVKRHIPAFIGCAAASYLMLVRIIRSKEDLFGYDVFYSFMIAFGLMSLAVQGLIHCNKYIAYMLKVFDVNNKTRSLARLTRLLNKMAAILLFVTGSVAFTPSLVEPQQTKKLLFVASAIMCSCCHVVTGVASTVLFTKYIRDLQSMLVLHSVQNSEFRTRVKRNLPRMKAVRTLYVVENLSGFFFPLLVVISDGWSKLVVYLIYIFMFMFAIGAILVFRASSRGQFRKGFYSSTGAKSERDSKSKTVSMFENNEVAPRMYSSQVRATTIHYL